ncbi:MAG: DUF5685 family protein [Candidatus Fimivivens sp.]
MFGYIKPLEPQLKVCELDTYKAVYCGVCRGLSKRFGPVARLTLSYDFTFIAMLYAALGDEAPTFAPHHCPLNPIKRRPHLEYSAAVEFSCEMAILLLHEKCLDNKIDARFPLSLGWQMLLPLSSHAAKKIGVVQPTAAAQAHEMTLAQQQVEALGDAATVDMSCDPTATALSEILGMISGDPTSKRILKRLGYMLGRFIYLCDAVDDLKDDSRYNRFNPLKAKPNSDEHAAILRLTMAEAANAYALLSPKYFKDILDNIIFIGLPATAERSLERGNQP